MKHEFFWPHCHHRWCETKYCFRVNAPVNNVTICGNKYVIRQRDAAFQLGFRSAVWVYNPQPIGFCYAARDHICKIWKYCKNYKLIWAIRQVTCDFYTCGRRIDPQQMRTALFWVITQRVMVISYDVLGQPIGSISIPDDGVDRMPRNVGNKLPLLPS